MPKIRFISRFCYGVDISFGDHYALGLQTLVPKEEMGVQPWNIVGLAFWIGPLVLLHLEIAKGRVAFGALNSIISFIWED